MALLSRQHVLGPLFASTLSLLAACEPEPRSDASSAAAKGPAEERSADAAAADGHGDAALAADAATASNDAGLLGPDAAAELASLSACPGTVEELFSKSVVAPPTSGSGVFHAADVARFAALEQSIRALVSGDVNTATSAAQTAAYTLCRADDAGSAVVVIRPEQSGQGHAVIAWRVQAERGLILEAPHAWHDAQTDIQSVELFVGLKARALVLSGIYRCASPNAAPCDGTTTACLGFAPHAFYTESDAAHNSDMLFQAAHVALSESFASDAVLSLHGFGYAGVSISNGTQQSPGADSLQVRLVSALGVALPDEPITSCQDYAGAPFEKRMCGSENVQGRHLNGSANVCAENAVATSDRFVHLEQSRPIRSNQRQAVLEALKAALDK